MDTLMWMGKPTWPQPYTKDYGNYGRLNVGEVAFPMEDNINWLSNTK